MSLRSPVSAGYCGSNPRLQPTAVPLRSTAAAEAKVFGPMVVK